MNLNEALIYNLNMDGGFMEISVDTAYIISTFIRKFMGSEMLMAEVIADVFVKKTTF